MIGKGTIAIAGTVVSIVVGVTVVIRFWGDFGLPRFAMASEVNQVKAEMQQYIDKRSAQSLLIASTAEVIGSSISKQSDEKALYDVEREIYQYESQGQRPPQNVIDQRIRLKHSIQQWEQRLEDANERIRKETQ